MVRSSVDLPEPEGPRITVTVPGDLQRHIVQRLVAAIVFADSGDRDMAIMRAGHERPPAAAVDVRIEWFGCCGRCLPPSGVRCAPAPFHQILNGGGRW